MPSSSAAVPTHAPGRTSATLPTLHQERWGRRMALYWRTAGGGPVQRRARGASEVRSSGALRSGTRRSGRAPASVHWHGHSVDTSTLSRACSMSTRHSLQPCRLLCPGPPRTQHPRSHAWHGYADADAPRGQSLTRSLMSASSATREGSELWGSGWLCCLLCAAAMGPRGDRLASLQWPLRGVVTPHAWRLRTRATTSKTPTTPPTIATQLLRPSQAHALARNGASHAAQNLPLP